MSGKRQLASLILAGLCIITFIMTGCTKDRVSIEYRLPEGDVSQYKITSTSITDSTSSDGKNHLVRSKTEATITQKVTNVDRDGNRILEVTYNDVKVTTEQEGKSRLNHDFRMTGKTYQMKISKNGELREFQDRKVNPGQSIGLLNQMDLILPEKVTKIGDSWTSQEAGITSMPIPGGAISMEKKQDCTYTLEKLEKIENLECAKILINSTVTERVKPGAEKPGYQAKGDGSIQGRVYFATKEGKIIKAEVKKRMRDSADFPDSDKHGHTAMKQEIAITMELLPAK